MLDKKESYTPAEAKRVHHQLDRLIAEKTLSPRRAGAHRRQIASRVRVALQDAYSEPAARRAKAEIVKLTESGTITRHSARAYRGPHHQAHDGVVSLSCNWGSRPKFWRGAVMSKPENDDDRFQRENDLGFDIMRSPRHHKEDP